MEQSKVVKLLQKKKMDIVKLGGSDRLVELSTEMALQFDIERRD